MKIALIILSLVLNAALGAALVVKKMARTETIASASASSAAAKRNASAAASATAPNPTSAGEIAMLRQFWPTAPGADIAAVIAKLKALGFPPGELLAIARQLVYEEMKPRWREIYGGAETPFWRNPSFYYDPKQVLVGRALQKEQSSRLKALLGDDVDLYAQNDFSASLQQRRYGDLPPEKFRKAEDVLRDYSEMTSDVFLAAQNGGAQAILLPEDREKLAYLEKQKREDLAKVLSPDELLEYDMRTSYTANQLRNQLVGFTPTEEEFRTLFKLEQAADERLGLVGTANGLATASSYRDRQAAIKALEPQIEAALGPDRAALFQQATDPQYAQMNRLAARLDLPTTAAVEVVGLQKDIQKRAALVRGDASLTPSDRTTQLTALQDEANTKISTALGGQRGLDAYTQYNGSWLQTLNRAAPARPAASK